MTAEPPHATEPHEGDEASDEDLFARFQAGDRDAFDVLVGRFKDRAYWVAFQMIRDADESLDLAQEAFAKTVVSAQSFDPSQKFSTWFFRILMNLCIDLLRKRKTRKAVSALDAPETAFEGPGPGEEVHAAEIRERVWAILGLLAPNHRALLVLRDIQGLSCIEIAEILRCTHATARWRLHRARTRFKEAWENHFGAPEA